MTMWTLKELIRNCNETHRCINAKWVPARPETYRHLTIRQRFRHAWMVFTGRAEAFIWPEQ